MIEQTITDSSLWIDQKRSVELQINDELPFIPDKFFKIGNVFGQKQVNPKYPFATVKVFEVSSQYAVIHYIRDGLEIEDFYRRGVWETGTNDVPRFHVFELLTI